MQSLRDTTKTIKPRGLVVFIGSIEGRHEQGCKDYATAQARAGLPNETVQRRVITGSHPPGRVFVRYGNPLLGNQFYTLKR
jgi:hypothetical protein